MRIYFPTTTTATAIPSAMQFTVIAFNLFGEGKHCGAKEGPNNGYYMSAQRQHNAKLQNGYLVPKLSDDEN